MHHPDFVPGSICHIPLNGQGGEWFDQAVQLLIGPLRVPDDFEFGSLAGQVIRHVFQDVSFVVTPYHAPVFGFGAGQYAFDAGAGIRPPIDDITSDEHAIGTPAIDMVKDGFQRVQVAVHVGEYGDLHGFWG